MSLENTVENLIDVINDIINSGYLRGSDMEEYAKDNIRYAQNDLNYKPQPDDWTKSPKGDFLLSMP